MSDNIVVVDSGTVLETTESSIIVKEEADRAEKWAKYSEAQAGLSANSALAAVQSRDAADASAAAAKQSEDNAADSAEEAKQYAIKVAFGNIGDIKYTSRTDIPNGGAWCDGAEYTQAMFPDIYQMLVDGKLQSTTYQNFSSSVSTKGSCGFFALDTATTSFKVPLLKDVYIKAGQAPSMFGAESLPNITGKVGSGNASTGQVATGAFGTTSEVIFTPAGGKYNLYNATFDASRSSSTYQNGAKVQPDHVVYRAYVVLYASAAEASVAQAQEFMTALSGKANVALDNVSPAQSFKDMSIGWGMPDYSAGIDVTSEFSAQTWWTATKSGWYVIAAGDESYFDIRANETETQRVIVAGAGPTPYILSSGVFVAEAGQRLYCQRKSGSYPVAMYYPFKGAN